jgi:predicted nuclease of predicted toxin-antitoxin system
VRVLFDHNLPHKLRTALSKVCTHDISTTSFVGWGHLKNGDLLRAAEDSGFDIFVTGDRTLVCEQNLSGRQLSIVALSTNNWPIIKNFLDAILMAIDNAKPGAFVEVDCGEFSRKRPASQP